MKIILHDFNYKGKHYDTYVVDMPNIKNVEDIPEERIVDYVIEGLEENLSFQKTLESQ